MPVGCNNSIGHRAVVGTKCQDLKYKISQDVPNYMMVAGGRSELRGLNLEGLCRHGFTDSEIRSSWMDSSNANSVGFEDQLAKLEQHETLAGVPVVLSMTQSIRDCFAENRRGICKFRHWNAS